MSRTHMQTQDSRTRRRQTLGARLLRDEAGNVLPLTAGVMVVMLGLVGGAVDMSGAYKTERRLQAACDAGVLAGRRAVTTNGFDTTASNQATAYFNNNFDPTSQESSNVVFTPVSTDNGNIVRATATAKSKTMIMKVFGYQSIDLTVNCSASMGVGNSDIVFVLDVTGSMADTPDGDTPSGSEKSKMESLQDSVKAFRTTVATSVSGSNARIRYGFVPYSSAVNVGRLLDASYISNSTPIQSRQMVNWTTNPVRTWQGTEQSEVTYDNGSYNDSPNWSKESDCEKNLPATPSWTKVREYSDEKSSIDTASGQKITAKGKNIDYTRKFYDCAVPKNKTNYRIYTYDSYYTTTSTDFEARDQVPVDSGTFETVLYKQRTFSTSTYKTFAATNTSTSWTTKNGVKTVANESSTWTGCIQERQTTAAATFAYDAGTKKITPATALDLDIDTAPTADDNTKWNVLWDEVTYYRTRGTVASESGTSASTYCPYKSQLLTTMTQSDFNTFVNALSPVGSTYHDIGLLWGARLASPTGIFATNVNEKPNNAGSVSRHLIFMTDGELAPTLTVNSSYGVERNDTRITGDGATNQYARHRSRFMAICEAIKARGIRLWVIAFGTTLDNDLKTCATTKSSYQADNATQLNTQFQEIAKQVGELRITQ